MDLKVIVRNVEDSAALRATAEEKLARTLERFEHMVISADMRLEDETGSNKHGVDKLCTITVKLRTGEVIIKEQDDEIYAALGLGLDRLKAAVSREISKSKRGIAEG
jgi:ribosomal subunit interface protein